MSKATTRQAALLLFVVFLVGFTAGVASEDWIEELPVPFLGYDRDYDDDLEDVIESEERLLRSLDLTSTQSDRVAQILARRESALLDYWAVRIPGMQQIIHTSRVEVSAVLNPEQRRRYELAVTDILRNAANKKD